jgi:hypothetical protein
VYEEIKEMHRDGLAMNEEMEEVKGGEQVGRPPIPAPKQEPP